MNLLVDVGNSRTKWALTSETGIGDTRVITGALDQSTLQLAWELLSIPRRIAVSNVRGPAVEKLLTAWCQEVWGCSPWILRSNDPGLGIKNDYHEPSQLGSDRVAAVLGARSLTEGDLVVVDCGTAVTINLLDAKNRFCGGAILPGPRLAAASLRERAPGIANMEAEIAMPKSVLGRTTAAGISSGAYFGIAGAIDRIIDEILSQRPVAVDLPIYCTGGEARNFQALTRRTMILDADLVLRGLLEALKRVC